MVPALAAFAARPRGNGWFWSGPAPIENNGEEHRCNFPD
jgi:hypothetical protein